jgi:Zn-dependent protease with chaperone function
MSYCVNCGKEYMKLSGICPHCHSDQVIPNEVIDTELSRRRFKRPDPHDPEFGFPGEKNALIISIIITVIVAFILGAISFGLFFAILIITLISLKITHLSSQKNMIRVSENSFANIFSLAKLAAFRLHHSLPEIFVVHDPTYGAYTIGFYRYGFIVVNSSLASNFSPTQLLFVIGHELGHMKRFHTTWLLCRGTLFNN